MIKFDFYNDCSGCGGCYNVCPVGAISMCENEEGFKVPSVDLERCTDCGLCEKVCPHVNKAEKKRIREKAWIYVSSDTVAKLKSSSGAAFYDIAKAGLQQGYHLCGCAWGENLVAEHIVGNDKKTLESLQGSKYVQSNTKSVYKEIVALLKKGNKVIFSGAPCQCTTLGNYVNALSQGKYRDNLITVGVICHGVASPLAWESFKKWTSEKEHSRLTAVNFRDKSREGYKKSYCRYDYENGKSTYLPTFLPSSKYIEATLVYNLAIRNSCFHCECKGHNENIDIILGDWYKEYEGEGSLGTSCIVSYTERGEKYLLDNLSGLKPIEYDEIYKENKYIEESTKLGANRSKFFYLIKDYKIWDNVERLYPSKYPIKKILVKTGLYDIMKGKKRIFSSK